MLKDTQIVMKLIKKLLKIFGKIIFLVKIDGLSAWPELTPGKFYLGTSLFNPKVGDWLIFKNPKNQNDILIKRVINFKNNSYFVAGNLSFSSSSRDFGLVKENLILGKLFFTNLLNKKIKGGKI